MPLEPNSHQPLLWHNPRYRDIAVYIRSLKLDRRLAAYDKLLERYAKRQKRGAAWPLYEPLVIFVVIALVGPGAILLARDTLPGLGLMFAGLIIAMAVEAYYTLRYRWLKRHLQGALHHIRKKYPVGTLLSTDQAWLMLNGYLRREYDLDLTLIMGSSVLYEATAGDIQAYLDETYSDFETIERGAELPDNVLALAQEAVQRIAKRYAAGINLTVAKVHLRQFDKDK